jgi:isopentenyldiphosphate isomerase
MKGGGFLQGYMRIFGQENLGRPEFDAENEVKTLRKYFAKQLDESKIPEIKPVLVFTTDEVELDANGSPIAAMKLKQLKEFMRQVGKNRVLTSDQVAEIHRVLTKD